MIIPRYQQKEFGKITKHFPKSISKHIDHQTRKLKFKVGKWRRNKAIKAEAEIADIIKKEEDLKQAIREGRKKPITGPLNENIDKKLLEDLENKYGTKYIKKNYNKYSPKTSPYAITDTKNRYAKAEIQHNKDPEVVEAIKDPKNKSIIVSGNPDTTSGKGHEGGHIENRWGKDKSKRRINAQDTPTRRARFEEDIDYTKSINPYQHYKNKKDSNIILTEEKNATENGLRMLKDLGMSDKEFKQSKLALQNSYKTYENQSRKKLNHGIRSIYQIPSRKHLTPKDEEVKVLKKGKLKKKPGIYYGDKDKIK